MNRMDLGGSLQNLAKSIEEETEPNIAELKDIIKFGDKIPLSDKNFSEEFYNENDENTSLTGHTVEGEDLQISFNDSETNQHMTDWRKQKKERIGYYILWRKEQGLLFFQHWKQALFLPAKFLDDCESAIKE